MSKRKQVKDSIKKREGEGLDDLMYGGSNLDDDFLANIDDSGQEVYQENEQLRQQVAQLEAQIAEGGRRLVIGDEMKVGEFVFSPIGLTVPDGASPADLQEIGTLLFRIEGSLHWLIGDWLAHAETYHWGQTEAIAEHFGRRVKTLYDYKYVAKNVNARNRVPELGFQHHALVAPMDDADQVRYLELARQGNPDPRDPTKRVPWTVAQFRAYIQREKTKSLPEKVDNLPDMKTPLRVVRSIFRVLQTGAGHLDERQRRDHLSEIAYIRRILDEAEDRLKTPPK